MLTTTSPNKKNANLLFNDTCKKAKDSLMHLIDSAEAGLNQDLSPIKNKLKDINKKPSPLFFLHHHLLKEAILSQSKKNVHNTLALLDCTKKERYEISQTIQFQILDEAEWTTECAKITQEPNKYNPCTREDIERDKGFLYEIKDRAINVLDIIKEYDQELYGEITEHLSVIILSAGEKLVGPLGYPLFGSTSLAYHGALFMQIPYEYKFFDELILEHIVHECAHIHLNSILLNDDLIMNNPDELYKSSVRKDLRPLLGIYHALFVSYRVLGIFKKCQEKFSSTYMKNQTKKVQLQFDGAFECIEKNAIFTPIGEKLFHNCSASYTGKEQGFIA